jgi:hypothetical protein
LLFFHSFIFLVLLPLFLVGNMSGGVGLPISELFCGSKVWVWLIWICWNYGFYVNNFFERISTRCTNTTKIQGYKVVQKAGKTKQEGPILIQTQSPKQQPRKNTWLALKPKNYYYTSSKRFLC